MNSMQILLRDYGVSDQSTNETDAMVFALLTYAANVGYSGGDTFANSVDEALRRLNAAGVGKVALDVLRARLNTLREKYAR
jgi:hypothetical protein